MGFTYQYPHPTQVDGAEVFITGPKTANIGPTGCIVNNETGRYEHPFITKDNLPLNLDVTGKGGLDQGAPAIRTAYAVYAIKNIQSTESAVIASTNQTKPVLPSGFDLYKKITEVYYDWTAQLVFRPKDRYEVSFGNTLRSSISETYAVYSRGIINLDFTKRISMKLNVLSGVVSEAGLGIRLYNPITAEVVTGSILNFVQAESMTLKTADITAYMANKSDRIYLELQYKKNGAGGAVDLAAASIEVK